MVDGVEVDELMLGRGEVDDGLEVAVVLGHDVRGLGRDVSARRPRRCEVDRHHGPHLEPADAPGGQHRHSVAPRRQPLGQGVGVCLHPTGERLTDRETGGGEDRQIQGGSFQDDVRGSPPDRPALTGRIPTPAGRTLS